MCRLLNGVLPDLVRVLTRCLYALTHTLMVTKGLDDDDTKATFSACITVADRINTLLAISTGSVSSGMLQRYSV
jgi:hypothetical protein